MNSPIQSKNDNDASSSVTNRNEENGEIVNNKIRHEAIDNVLDTNSSGTIQQSEKKEDETRNQTDSDNDVIMTIDTPKDKEEHSDNQNDEEQLQNKQEQEEQKQQQEQPQSQEQQQNENTNTPNKHVAPPSNNINNTQFENNTTTSINNNNAIVPSNTEQSPNTQVITVEQPTLPYIPLLYLEDFEFQPTIIDYKCQLCSGIIWEPIVDNCSHGFCKSCFEIYLKLNPDNKTTLLCPISHEPTSIQTGCNFIKTILEKQIVFCHFKLEGCAWKGTVKDYLIHLDTTCPRQRIKCALQGCEQLAPREQMQTHISNCDFRIVQCENCDIKTPFISLTKHYTTCPKYPMECPQQCTKKVQRENIDEHITNECPNTKVKCPYYDVGCKCMYAKKDGELHHKENYTNHLSYMFVNFNKKNEELEHKIQQLNQTITAIQEENNNNNRILNKKRQRFINEEDEDVNVINQETTINTNNNYETPTKKRKIIDDIDIHSIRNSNNNPLALSPIRKTPLEMERDIQNKSFFDTARIPNGVRVTDRRVASTLFLKDEHKFVFVNHKVSNITHTSWKVCFIKQPQWVFIGLCDKDKVIENNMKFFSCTLNFNHGCFGYSTNNFIWNSRLKGQNNCCISRSKVKKNDEIRFKYNPYQKELQLSSDLFTQTLLMVEPIISQSLTICVIFANTGDEVEINII